MKSLMTGLSRDQHENIFKVLSTDSVGLSIPPSRKWFPSMEEMMSSMVDDWVYCTLEGKDVEDNGEVRRIIMARKGLRPPEGHVS